MSSQSEFDIEAEEDYDDSMDVLFFAFNEFLDDKIAKALEESKCICPNAPKKAKTTKSCGAKYLVDDSPTKLTPKGGKKLSKK